MRLHVQSDIFKKWTSCNLQKGETQQICDWIQQWLNEIIINLNGFLSLSPRVFDGK